MNGLENTAFSFAFVAYLAATFLYGLYIANRQEWAGTLGTWATIMGWGANTAALVARSVNTGTVPFTNGYEFLLGFAWGIIGVYLFVEYRMKTRVAGVFVVPIAWLIMAYIAILIPPSQKLAVPIMPALKSSWLTLHVFTAIVSYGAFAVSFGLSLLYLYRTFMETRSDSNRRQVLKILPSLGRLDEFSYQSIAFGFLVLTLVIITGAVWAEQAWGSYWSWDPKETWSLVTWLVYAGYLHARLTRGWTGQRAVVMALIGFAAVLFTFFGVNYFLPGFHSYA